MAEIEAYGVIEEGFAKDIRAQLRGIDPQEPVEVRISSEGGFVGEGVAAYNTLSNIPNPVTVFIDGDCFSAATLLAMAGDERQIHSNCYMMIHDPWLPIISPATIAQLEKDTKYLKAVKKQAIEIYRNRVDLGPQKLSSMMRDESYITSEDALGMKFVTNVIGPTAAVQNKAPEKYQFVRNHDKLANMLKKRPVVRDVSDLLTRLGVTIDE